MTKLKVGDQKYVQFDDVMILCEVKEVKPSYGRMRLLVEPVKGRGQQWVEVARQDATSIFRTKEN